MHSQTWSTCVCRRACAGAYACAWQGVALKVGGRLCQSSGGLSSVMPVEQSASALVFGHRGDSRYPAFKSSQLGGILEPRQVTGSLDGCVVVHGAGDELLVGRFACGACSFGHSLPSLGVQKAPGLASRGPSGYCGGGPAPSGDGTSGAGLASGVGHCLTVLFGAVRGHRFVNRVDVEVGVATLLRTEAPERAAGPLTEQL